MKTREGTAMKSPPDTIRMVFTLIEIMGWSISLILAWLAHRIVVSEFSGAYRPDNAKRQPRRRPTSPEINTRRSDRYYHRPTATYPNHPTREIEPLVSPPTNGPRAPPPHYERRPVLSKPPAKEVRGAIPTLPRVDGNS